MSLRGLLLLDTNIVIHLFRGNAVGRRVDRAYGLRQSPERPLISVVTVGEVLGFCRQCNWGDAKLSAIRLLTEFVVVDINHVDVLERYASLRGHGPERWMESFRQRHLDSRDCLGDRRHPAYNGSRLRAGRQRDVAIGLHRPRHR